MKKLISTLLILILLFISCSKDDDSTPDIDPETPELPTATETCLYSDFTIEANSTVTIDCLLDLEGKTIAVPEGVIFEFDGGDIFNGTLNFAAQGKIDGELLNSKLELEGEVVLTSEVFQFIPSRWEIVEATTLDNPQAPTQEIAYNNHMIIQRVLDLTHEMGSNTFSIGKMNAFFDCINGETTFLGGLVSVMDLPSDFNLIMTDETYFRVQPISGRYSSMIIRIDQKSNINVTGGNFIGDRLEHGPEDGGSVLFKVNGGKNILIDGVSMTMSSHSGLTILSQSFISRPDYFGSENIMVKNCYFDANRTNNLSLTDGQNIIIEGNTSTKAGIELEGRYYTSTGVEPRIGIVVETQPLQYIEGVIIRNNIIEETQSSQDHSILAVGATDVEITGNTADKSVGWSSALDVRVTNNIVGRVFGGFLGFEGIDNIISGNTVTNEDGIGILLTDQNVKVYDNDIINCKTGIQIASFINADIYDNRITSSIEGATGITGQGYLDNVTVRENEFNLTSGKPFDMQAINKEIAHGNYLFTFKDNIINATKNGLTPGSSNIEIINNEFYGAGIAIGGEANNIIISNNTIRNDGDFAGFAIDLSNNIEVTGNTFENTNEGSFANGTLITNSDDIVFNNNTVTAVGVNHGMVVRNTVDNITIDLNTIQNESQDGREPLHFSGSNSTITNNTFINSLGNDAYFEGDSNTISGNTLQ